MRIYFDCEFTELAKDCKLISIGFVDSDDRRFYAEFNDYGDVSEWHQREIIPKLLYNDIHEGMVEIRYDRCFMKGDFNQIRDAVNNWLSIYDEVQFTADVSHYDFVLLIDLICGHALKLPDNISAYCHDINQDMAEYCGISEKDAFDLNRESFAQFKGEIKKHNALFDAEIAKIIYEMLH